MRKALFACLLIAVLCAPALADTITKWREVAAESEMAFTQNPAQAPVPVSSFKTDIDFEPAQYASSKVVIYADLGNAFLSTMSLSPDLRQALDIAGSLGAAPKPGPGTGVLTSTAIRKEGEGRFLMDATLSLNGRTKAVQVPFTAAVRSYFDLPKLVMQGSFSFDPRDFADEAFKAPDGVDAINVTFKIAQIPAE